MTTWQLFVSVAFSIVVIGYIIRAKIIINIMGISVCKVYFNVKWLWTSSQVLGSYAIITHQSECVCVWPLIKLSRVLSPSRFQSGWKQLEIIASSLLLRLRKTRSYAACLANCHVCLVCKFAAALFALLISCFLWPVDLRFHSSMNWFSIWQRKQRARKLTTQQLVRK